MSGSAISILYLVFLAVLFIILIVMTVTLVASKKKKDGKTYKDFDDEIDEYDDDEVHDFDEYEEEEYNNPASEETYNVEEDSAFSDNAFGDSAFGDSAFGDSVFGDSAFGDSVFGDSVFGDSAFSDSAFGENVSSDVGATEEDDIIEEEVVKTPSPMDTTQKLPQQEVKDTIKKQIQEAKQMAETVAVSPEVEIPVEENTTQIEASVDDENPAQEKVSVDEKPLAQEETALPEDIEVKEDTLPQEEMPAEDDVAAQLDTPVQMRMPVMQPVAPMRPITPMQPIAPMQSVAPMQPVEPMQPEATIEQMEAVEDEQYASNTLEDSAFRDSAFGTDDYEDIFADPTLADSAFVESKIPVLSDEAIQASVKEAEAMGAAVTGMTGSLVDVTAAIAEQEKENEKVPAKKLGRMHKQTNNKNLSYAHPSDDFFWFNMVDASERPSYKTVEMYYHHFNLAEDCIEDLLIEMYDSGLVRTEEIRYIAYGIEPRAVSIKEILTSGNSNYAQHEKKKMPTTQDLVNIYEKWCGYVDKLFDIIEIHADEMTYNKIRHMLYEYGRSDVDELIEGK